ncbi:hypothetical protein LOY64_29985 (plasmid) [Pseudomonas corrugata]|uniref:hypothetical protein n=1 Tax=Pseudomonas corrugata TaxID=47879 RepID=UPI00222EA49B|nr:hypothetical protein [Pseudomonas corrugata]UZD98495.1 hypothetical protein LOY64_30410 [Pseudomonas corrugata]UZD98500.1 hypothetical protein LOY64_29985 [Pseudomonas corrugata]
MKRSDDPTGLQILFNGVVAIAIALHVVGVFIYRIYTQRTDDKATNQDEQA